MQAVEAAGLISRCPSGPREFDPHPANHLGVVTGGPDDPCKVVVEGFDPPYLHLHWGVV